MLSNYHYLNIYEYLHFETKNYTFKHKFDSKLLKTFNQVSMNEKKIIIKNYLNIKILRILLNLSNK